MELTAQSLQYTRTFRRQGAVAATFYLLAVLATGGAMYGFIWHQGGETPPTVGGAHAALPLSPHPIIAGTGAALPLLEALATGYAESGGGVVLIPPSLGSGGGLRALADGVIDCAVVSRDLNPEEAQGYRVIPLAHAPVVLAGGRNVPADAVADLDELVALIASEVNRNASSFTFVLREPGDSGQMRLAEALPAVATALGRAQAAGHWPVAYTDADMERMLLESRHAVGVFDAGTIALGKLPLTPLTLPGDLRLQRPFLLVCSPSGVQRLQGFLAHLATPAVRSWMRDLGYQPAGD
jgi:hypothetical protein